MKNLTNYKKVVISISCFIIGICSMSFVNPTNEEYGYQILSTKISICGSGKFIDWKLTMDTLKLNGKFNVQNEQLEDISDLNFNLTIGHLKANGDKTASIMQDVLNKHNCHQLIFTQKRIMILPIMRSVHMVGEIQMANYTHVVSMQMQYILNDDQSITLKAKQNVFLSELGIDIPGVKAGSPDDEISIYLDVLLIKDQQAIAKSGLNKYLRN